MSTYILFILYCGDVIVVLLGYSDRSCRVHEGMENQIPQVCYPQMMIPDVPRYLVLHG